MATVTTTVGTRSAENIDITGTSGAGPYTVTLSTATTDTANGDALTDENATPRTYLITAGAGTTSLTVEDVNAVGAAPDSSGTSQAKTTRYYSTVALWEIDLADTDLYTAGDTARLEPYADADINAQCMVLGNPVPDDFSIIPVSSERHDGTAGTGVKFTRTAAGEHIWRGNENGFPGVFEWIDWDAEDQQIEFVIWQNNHTGTYRVRNCLVHNTNITSSTTFGSWLINIGGTSEGYITNCILYNMQCSNNGTSVRAISWSTHSTRIRQVFNTTIFNITNSGTSTALGLDNDDTSGETIKNTMSLDCDDGDFNIASPSNATMEYNMSSDTTASGTGSLTSKTAANQFVSTTVGSEDLHLKAGADAIDAGTDLVTTPTNVEIDIDGYDRNAGGVTWDMGADEFVAAGGHPAMSRFGGVKHMSSSPKLVNSWR